MISGISNHGYKAEEDYNVTHYFDILWPESDKKILLFFLKIHKLKSTGTSVLLDYLLIDHQNISISHSS